MLIASLHTIIALNVPASLLPPDPPVKKPEVLWKVPISSGSFGGSAIADVDGDGKPEVAFATYFGDARVRVLRGTDGSEVWSYREGDHCYDASLRFFDLDADGKLELVVPCSDASTVFAFDAADGTLRWSRGLARGECIDTPPYIGDVDGDAKPEVVVGTFKGHYFVISGADGKVKRTLDVAPGAVQSCPAVLDLDADGTLDFVAANFRGDHAFHAVSGKDGAKLWKVQTEDHIYHGPSQARFAKDGPPVLAGGSYDGHVYAFRTNGELVWKLKTGDRYIMAPTVAVDIDGDGIDEVISTSQKITAINAAGKIVWQQPAGESDMTAGTTRGVAVADMDNDGAPDLSYLDDTGLFRVRRARDGVLLYEFDAGTLLPGADLDCSNAPAIADLNADGRLEVFFVIGKGTEGKRTGLAVAVTGFEGRGEGWRMFRHDPQNTGNPRTPITGSVPAPARKPD